MNINKTFVGLVVIIAVIATWIGVSYPKTPAEISVDKIVSEVKGELEKLDLGATVGPELSTDYFNFGGFEQNMKPIGMNAASSTVCRIKTPSASSTLIGLFANFAKPPTVATTLRLATSTDGYATTSVFYSTAILANGTSTVAWLATTTGITAKDTVLVPNTYVLVDLQGAATYSGLVGRCYAEFRSFR